MERKHINILKGIYGIAMCIGIVLFIMWRFGLQKISDWGQHITNTQAACLLGGLGLIILIVSYCLKILCKQNGGLNYLAIVTLMLATWTYLRSGVVNEVYQDTKLIETIKITMLLLVPIPTMLFFNEIQRGRYQKIYPPFIIISLLDWAVCVAGVNITSVNVDDLYMSGQIVMMMGISSCIYTIFADAIKGKRKYARLTFSAMIFLFVGCIFEIVYVYNREKTWIDRIFGFILFIVVLDVFVINAKLVVTNYQDLQKMHMQQERNRLIKKLNAEMQKPMKNILKLNESILDKCMDEEIYLTTAEIDYEGNTMLRLIQNVKDCVTLENDEFVCKEEIFSWSDVYNNMVDKMFKQTDRKGIELILNIAEDMPDMMYGDMRCVDGILENIFDNAVRYVEKGSITMNVGWLQLSEDTVKVFTAIEDTGVGIEPEMLEGIKYAFSHLDEVEESNLQGIGYGLQTVIRLARIIHDTLEIESEVNKGTIIRIACTHKVADWKPIGEFQNWYVIKENSYQSFKKRIAKLQKNKKENDTEQPIAVEQNEQNADNICDKELHNIVDILESQQIHMQQAMKYVGNDLEQYIELMKMFPKKAPEKQKAIINYLMNKDYQNYIILVHSLKNNARTLGADTMADMAYELEVAATKEDDEYIQQNTKAFIEEWKRVEQVFTAYIETLEQEMEQQPAISGGKLSEESWFAQVEQIKKYLDSFKKKEALEILETLKGYQLQGEQRALVEEVMDTIKKYDYAKAIELLA